MLLANFWTKYLNRSWVEGLSWMAQQGVDADLVVAVINWQWAIGFFVRATIAPRVARFTPTPSLLLMSVFFDVLDRTTRVRHLRA